MGSLLLTGIPAGIASAPTCGPARPSRTGFDQSWVACWLLHTLVVALHIHNGSACRFDKSPVASTGSRTCVRFSLVAAAPVYQLVAAGGKRVQRRPGRNPRGEPD